MKCMDPERGDSEGQIDIGYRSESSSRCSGVEVGGEMRVCKPWPTACLYRGDQSPSLIG